MPLGLYPQAREETAGLPRFSAVEPGAWNGFFRGTGQVAMRTFAQAGRAAGMLLSVGPIAYDAFTDGGTEAQDRYFRAHDDFLGSAVDYWTPKPGEVGLAGEVVGTLLGTLPLVIASPHAAVAAMELGTAEELVRRGAPPGRAVAAGAAQATGLALGIWVPV